MIGKKGNKYIIDEEAHIARICLHRTKDDDLWTTIDLEDLKRVIDFPYTWFSKYNHTNDEYYAVASVYRPELKRSSPMFLHQFLMDAGGKIVDHKNNDSLDNRKSNLRIVENSDNLTNRKSKNKNNTSGHRNVMLDKKKNEWIVQLFIDGKNKRLGRFPYDELDKAGAFAEEMRAKYYGEFAGRVNQRVISYWRNMIVSKYISKKIRLPKIDRRAAYIFVVVFSVLITALCQTVKYKRQIKELCAYHDEEMSLLRAELREDYEIQMTELKRYYEYGGDISQIEREAEYIAKVLYGTAANHADSDKRAVVWCILNRVDYYSHPDTVAEVCEQPKQWMGYSSDNPVVADLYELALEELKVWHSGEHRPMNSSYIYLSWSSKEILLRDTFEVSKSTNYWRMR